MPLRRVREGKPSLKPGRQPRRRLVLARPILDDLEPKVAPNVLGLSMMPAGLELQASTVSPQPIAARTPELGARGSTATPPRSAQANRPGAPRVPRLRDGDSPGSERAGRPRDSRTAGEILGGVASIGGNPGVMGVPGPSLQPAWGGNPASSTSPPPFPGGAGWGGGLPGLPASPPPTSSLAAAGGPGTATAANLAAASTTIAAAAVSAAAAPRTSPGPASVASQLTSPAAAPGAAGTGAAVSSLFTSWGLTTSNSSASGAGLLGLAQETVAPDIASGGQTTISYVHVGNNDNPFRYTSIPLQLTLGGGTKATIRGPSSGGSASIDLKLSLDNNGLLSQVQAGGKLTVTGKVVINGKTFDGTLLTAQAREFGFSTPKVGNTDFVVRLVVTGGKLAEQPDGVVRVGDTFAHLIHQPGLKITSFPASFSLRSFTGASDLKKVREVFTNPGATQPPVIPGDNGIDIGCCGSSVPYPTADGGPFGSSAATGGFSVYLFNGEYHYEAVDLTIPGRGFNWTFERAYRSAASSSGPLGNNWDFNYSRRLIAVTASNRQEIQATFPGVKVGDVVRYNGLMRADLYVRNPDGSYAAPAGYFTSLALNPDGSYTERDAAGMSVRYAAPAADGTASMTSMADRNGNTMGFQYNGLGQLVRVIDTLGRPIDYIYDTNPTSPSNGSLVQVRDFTGRTLRFQYDVRGDLVSATSPAVTGTVSRNDFPQGKTERYTYSSGFRDERLNSNLLTVTAPNEVANGGMPRVVLSYGVDPTLPSFDRVTTQLEGGINAGGVPAGGAITYRYLVLGTAAPGDLTTPVFQTTTTDRNGNLIVDQFNQQGSLIRDEVFTNRDIRPGDPPSYVAQFEYNRDFLLLSQTLPAGNSVRYVYDSGNPNRLLQGDLLSETDLPDAARGGDQSRIVTTYTYEPLFNQLRSATEARGNDGGYVPPNGGANSPARYSTTYTYDYQEGTNFAGLGLALGLSTGQVQTLLAAAGIPMGLGDVNGDGRTDQIHGNPIRIDDPTVHLLPGSNQAVVEGSTLQPIVTLMAYNAFGQMTSLTDPEKNVTAWAYYPASDPNGDGFVDDPAGDPATGGYLKQTLVDTTSDPSRDSGTNPTPANIRNLFFYDAVGNVIRSVDGRGIATDFSVNALNQVVQIVHAAAHGVFAPGVAEPLPLADFRYLERFAYDANDNLVLREVEDRGNTSGVQGNPAPADLPMLGVSLAGTSTGGNGATTLADATQHWITNQWAGQAVRITSGLGVGQFAVVASNTANRLTLTTPWTTLPDASSRYAIYPLISPDPAGGPTAFVDFVTKYDILDRAIESVQEVSNGTNPEFLRSRVRFDPNGNVVLSIRPEGNAVATVYDERNLPYEVTRGAIAPPPLTLLAANDPVNYGVRGGIPSTTTSFYDRNSNLVESVTADDSDGSLANNSTQPTGTSTGGNGPTTLRDTARAWTPNQWRGRTVLIQGGTGAGQLRTIASNTSTALTVSAAWAVVPDSTSVYAIQGDRTRYTYDGFDRLTSVIDSVGNQSVYQYDPASNIVRTTRFGPVGGPSPTSDGPATPSLPVSSGGVIQAGNLVTSNLLTAGESSFDELGRNYQDSAVLFVNTIPTARPPDVAAGATDLGKGSLTPGQTQSIPGLGGVTILGRVSERTEFDRNSRPTFRVQDDLDTARIFYDGVGRLIESVDPEGNTVERAYDGDSNVIESRQTDHSQVPGVAPEVFLLTNFYDSLNRVQQVVDNVGQSTQYRYDSRGNLVAMADASGPAGPTISRRAFPDGPRTVDATNLFGNVSVFSYDGLGRQTRTERILTAAGQGDGTHIGASLFGIKNDPGSPESFTPTPDVTQGGGDGIIRTGTIWDANSRRSALLDDNGNLSIYLYDNLDRQVAEAKGLISTSTLTKQDVLGPEVIPTPTTATIDDPSAIPDGLIDAQLAEIQGRLSQVAPLFPSLADTVEPPTTIVVGYGLRDEKLIQRDENKSALYTRHDAIRRPIAVRIFRAGQNDSFAGDPVFAPDPVPLVVDPTGDVVTGTTREDYQYDGLSRITSSADNNDPASASDDASVAYAYDSLGRLIEETQRLGNQAPASIDSAWRAEGLRSRLIYPDGRVLVYTYDDLDRLATVADLGASLPIAAYSYIGPGRVLERDTPLNGTRQTTLDDTGTVDVGYDGLARMVQLRSLRSDNSLIVGFTYTYDRANNILTEGKLHDAPNSQTYGYDSSYRLIRFGRQPGGIAPIQGQWSLDGTGNWTQVDGETRQHSSTNEIIQRADGVVTTSMTYDSSGNELDDGTYQYSYDALNRLDTVVRISDGQLVASYAYDAAGRRVSKVVSNSGPLDGETRFLYDGQTTIEERNGSGIVAQQYVYGAGFGELLTMDRNLNGDGTAIGPGDQRLYDQQNAAGSTFALVDAQARLVEAYQYDAYGRQVVFLPGAGGVVHFGPGAVLLPGGASVLGNPYTFTGQRQDAETGLLYYRSRYYDTQLGRFTSRDPMGYAFALNQYEYVSGNPGNLTDPSGAGFWSCVGSFVAAAVVTAVVAAAVAAVVVAAPVVLPALAASAAITLGASAATAATVATVTSVTVTAATVGLGAYGAYQTYQSGKEVWTGVENGTGRRLSPEERSARAGGIVGGFAGGFGGGAAGRVLGRRAANAVTARTLTQIAGRYPAQVGDGQCGLAMAQMSAFLRGRGIPHRQVQILGGRLTTRNGREVGSYLHFGVQVNGRIFCNNPNLGLRGMPANTWFASILVAGRPLTPANIRYYPPDPISAWIPWLNNSLPLGAWPGALLQGDTIWYNLEPTDPMLGDFPMPGDDGAFASSPGGSSCPGGSANDSESDSESMYSPGA